jgi:hypothetical protein
VPHGAWGVLTFQRDKFSTLVVIQLRSQDILAQFSLSFLFYFQHREGIYWFPTPRHNEDESIYKVRAAADEQAAPQPPIKEYISDLLVGSDDDAPATRRAPPNVATSAPGRTR